MTTLPQLKSVNTVTLPSLYSDPFLVGFDRIFDELMKFSSSDRKSVAYPPYNIIKIDENNYEIQIAVAGFEKSELDVSVENAHLTIKGSKIKDDETTYIHQGIAARDFIREFTLAETVEIEDVSLKSGMLFIKLKNNIPEHKLARQIPIK
jgi:molecular chaperone IbpA